MLGNFFCATDVTVHELKQPHKFSICEMELSTNKNVNLVFMKESSNINFQDVTKNWISKVI